MTQPHTAPTPALPVLPIPAPNRLVLDLLAAHPLRDPRTAAGRPLYLHRLGVLAVPQGRDRDGWWCTAAGATLDQPAPAGLLWVCDVEVAAALEVRSPLLLHVDLTAQEFLGVWMVRVWDRWPGGRIVQLAQALLEQVDPVALTVCTGPPWRPVLARRAGLPSVHGLARHVEDLAAAGLLVALFVDVDADAYADPDRRYRLGLPPALTPAATSAVTP